MDKYEYKVRAEEIKQLIAYGEYPQAVEIADTIDWRRVKSVMMLCTISDLYKINRRYEEARDLLLMAYERRPNSRNIIYSLCELSIKTGEYVQAVEYYKEFVQIAPQDSDRYVLQYKLYVAQEVGLEERIEVLEELKRHDYKEKWAYELAYLYHKIGLGTRCVEECDELIMMMGSGRYVTKAMELKMLHEPLTPQQQEKYDHRNDLLKAREQTAEQPWEDRDGEEEPGETPPAAEQPADNAAAVTGDTQIYEPVRTGAEKRYVEEYVGRVDEPKAVDQEQEALDREQEELAREQEELDREQEELAREQEELDREQEEIDREQEEQPIAEPELDIYVKPVNVGEYDTINLQAQLAKGLQEILTADQRKEQIEDPVTRSIVAPMLEDDDTESLDYPEIDEVDAEDLEPEPEQMENSEVFFGETGEISAGELLLEGTEEAAPQETAGLPEDATGRIVMEQMRINTAEIRPIVLPEPPKEMAHVLSQESDGQISMVLPEAGQVEKQITGQLSIEDILAEWERVKKENEEKRKEEVRQHVLQTTGPMFTEFEAAVRDEILAKTPKEDENKQETEPEPEAIRYEPLPSRSKLEAEKAGADGSVSGSESEELVEDGYAFEEIGDAFEEIEDLDAADDIEILAEEFEAAGKPEAAAETESETNGNGTPTEEAEPEDAADADEELTFDEETATDEKSESDETPVAEEAAAADEEAAPKEEPEPEKTPENDEKPEDAAEPEESAEEASDEDISDEDAEAGENPEADSKSDRPKVRALTREEKELYAPFIQSRKAREQIATAIDNISMAAYTGNVIVTGEEGMDTLTLARNIIREVQSSDSNFSGKVAKISGHALNRKDVAATLEQLHSGALIIQRASEMEKDTAKALRDALQRESLGIVIVLEDNRKAMNRFLRENEPLRELFTARIDVEAMSNDTLVAFGRQYAHEMEYSISDLGILELHRRVEDLQTFDHIVTAPEVKKIVDEAIRHANRKTPKHFFDVLFNKRYDDEDMIVLTDKDFS